MFVKKHKSKNGRIFLTLTHGYSVEGKTKHKTIENLGYLDELEKEFDDPIAHFKEIAKQRTLQEKEANAVNFTISTNETLPSNTDNRKNLGYAILKNIYQDLGLHTFFQKKQRSIEAEFNLNSIFSLLTYGRILAPASKKATYESRSKYFESFNFSIDDVYRSLPHFNSYAREIQKHLNERIAALYGRDTSLSYYDVTNYYFEISLNDEDEIDDDGNVIKSGFRKKGVCKSNSRHPIVQMGLLMDKNGLPMAYNTFPGNDSEKTSLLPTIRQLKIDNGIERIVVVADRGLNTSDNTFFLAGKNDDDTIKNDGYIYGQSIRGADAEFKRYVLDQDGYVIDKEVDEDGEVVYFKHKSRIFAKNITTLRDEERKNKTTTYQKQMIYYSDKYARKQKAERDQVLKKAKDLIANPTKYNKSTSYGAAKYIKNIKYVKKTGEIAEGLDLSLDKSKIEEEEKYDGYYSIVTSEIEMTDQKLREAYRGLWKIEDSFKVLKSEFKTRPVYLAIEEHINAHFLICFVSLVIMRVLEHRMDGLFSMKELRSALINYGCSQAHENYYLFDYRNDVLEAMEKEFSVDFSLKYMSRKQIKNILKNK